MPKKHVEKVQKLSTAQIKKITPYLDDVRPKLTPKQRNFCWYYCNNGFNGIQACEASGYKVGTKHKDAKDVIKANIFKTQACQNLTKPYIIEAIKRILKNIVNINKDTVEFKLFHEWLSQAFYKPSMFVNPDGSLAFKSWKEIPEEYHCCVAGIEKKYYGRNADKEVIIIKLVNKKDALDKLDKYVQMTKDIIDVDVNLKEETLDKLGEILKGKKKKK